jgi:hypothetical protein
MFSRKNIVITIGSRGSVVALHDKERVLKKIFVEDFSQEAKAELLKTLFSKNKLVPVYLLLDTIDQSYKKRVYPSIKITDLSKIIRRDLASDGDKESFKNYIALKQVKQGKSLSQESRRREFMFVSISASETINAWVNFIANLPNQLVGVYTVPLECYNLYLSLRNSVKAQSKAKNKKSDLCCFVIEGKAGGMRQMVFSQQGIIFTRVFGYDTQQHDFVQKYEKDLHGTFEYLKRLFPDLVIGDLEIFNILPQEVLDKLKEIQNTELNLVNYTPYKAALDLGFADLLSKESKFCDILISRIFFKKRKILKFGVLKTKSLEKFFVSIFLLARFNICATIFALIMALILSVNQMSYSSKIEAAQLTKANASQDLDKLKKAGLETSKILKEDEINIDKIFDYGRTEEQLGSLKVNIQDLYTKLKFLKDFNMRLKKFSYSAQGFNPIALSKKFAYKTEFSGDLYNQSGDLDNLFKEFDALTGEVRKKFDKDQVTNNELPTNIDFNKKYYDFAVNFTINSSN